MNNKGILKEDEFLYFLNNRGFEEIPDNLQKMMKNLFGIVDPYKEISCEKTQDFIKPDIVISHRDISKAISIKTGKSKFLHSEQIKPFILFLRSLGVSSKTQQTFLLFLYGDGTMDGTGKERYDVDKVNAWLKDRIKAANEELNKDKNIIVQFVDRVIFAGVNPEARQADAIYHGDVNHGFLATRKQVSKHIQKKNWDYYEPCLHIGPIKFTATMRFVGKKITNEKRRHYIQCYWPLLDKDIEYISKRYTDYSSPYKMRSE